MLANLNDITIQGTIEALGILIAVAGKQTLALQKRLAFILRGLYLGLGQRLAHSMMRMSSGHDPRLATCTANTATRCHQRNWRWSPGVVVGPGTVGVRC